MKSILRNVLAVIIGLFTGGIVNMALVVIGPHVIPPPPGVDLTNAQSLAASIHLLQPRHFLFPFLAHALGTLVGALVAYLIAANGRRWLAYGIGILSLAGGIAAARMIPAPAWFVTLDLVAAYLPMAALAACLGRHLMAPSAPAGSGDAAAK